MSRPYGACTQFEVKQKCSQNYLTELYEMSRYGRNLGRINKHGDRTPSFNSKLSVFYCMFCCMILRLEIHFLSKSG